MKSLIGPFLALCADFSTASITKHSQVTSPHISVPPVDQLNHGQLQHEHRITDEDRSKYPNITLDYGIHLPTLHNKDSGYVLYKNIRYAQNPTKDLRFKLPKAPDRFEGDPPIFDGSYGHSCYQSFPQWAMHARRVVDPTYDWTHEFRTETDGEDCLFLDVAIPLVVENELYPVIVWIHGGGFVYGAKDWDIYSPAGFYRRASANNKFLFVALNYRMGAFGFLSGPAFKAEEGQSNLGLHDQRLALKWVQDNIAKFGGDPNQVTVMGESAGAGSITHHLVWNEESKEEAKVLFQRAILQSPAWVPVPGTSKGFNLQDDTYESFLEIVGAEGLWDLKGKDIQSLVEANRKFVGKAPHGTFGVGPVVDGTNIKGPPITILASGDPEPLAVEILTSVVAGEGLVFVPFKTIPPPSKPLKWLTWKDWTDDDLISYVKEALPLIDPQMILGILNYYPKDDPSYSYLKGEYIGISRQTQRLADIVGQGLIQCNARGIATSFGRDTYNFVFSIVDNTYPNSVLHLPLLHGGDVPYTFYDLPPSPEIPFFNVEVAEQWQKYILGFALKSNPNYLNPTINITKYGEENRAINFDYTKIASAVSDPYANVLCDSLWPSVWGDYGSYEAPRQGHEIAIKAKAKSKGKPLVDVGNSGARDVFKEEALERENSKQDVLLLKLPNLK